MLTRRDLLRATALTGLVVFADCGADDEGPSVGDLRLVASDLQREVADPAAVTAGFATVRSLAAGLHRQLAAGSGNLALSRGGVPRRAGAELRGGRAGGRLRGRHRGGARGDQRLDRRAHPRPDPGDRAGRGAGRGHSSCGGGSGWRAAHLAYAGALTMPRFGFLAAAPLTPTLEALGAVDAFGPDAAVVDPR